MLVLFGATSVLSQTVAPTSEEEYNYGSVGYRIQLQTRMSDKQGYEIRESEICEEPGRRITFKQMFRISENQPCAYIMVYDRPGVSPFYYCIPSANASPALWDRFHESLTGGTDKPVEQLQFFSTCISRMLMKTHQLQK